jgi:uncharacterized protein YbgA (DUF1722 family)/uncharacterized protein YbbK (DUF523 family)
VSTADPRPVRVGISSCLLGEEVRFDGGHKRDGFLVGTLGPYVEWVPVCPEVEVGMGTPREPIRLVRVGDAVRLIGTRSAEDWTVRMERFARARAEALAPLGLSGYVLKKDSPSCGMTRVKVYPAAGGVSERNGTGLFAAALKDRFPSLPVEEEGRLSDPRLRENFVERVFAYHRLQGLFGARWTVGDLVRFHTAHKLVLLAHQPSAYASLGRLVASATSQARADLRARYEAEFMEALARIATPGRHANVLQHVAGYFKKDLDGESRAELQQLIDDHRRGLVPLIVPITLVRHHARRLRVAYLEGQVYLSPHPKELALRNHV